MIKNSKGTIVVSVVMSVVLILVAFLVWPNKNIIDKNTQSNDIDDSKTQIKVIAKRINIRQEPDINSSDIGDVYAGEIYTVIEDITKDDYYWYKIKTNTNIEGYIASSKDEEYVEVISGYIDRTPPVINYDKDYYVIFNGEEDYSLITCTDDHSICTIDINKSNLYLDITARDERGNTKTKSIRYYDIFKSANYFNETNSNLNVNYTRTINSDNSLLITANYILNKMILSDNKSTNYGTNINLYDEDFNIIKTYETKYNVKEPDGDCLNDKSMNLKDDYLESNLNVGDKLCTSFLVPNSESVKYFEISISGIDNYGSEGNYLSNYISRLFMK